MVLRGGQAADGGENGGAVLGVPGAQASTLAVRCSQRPRADRPWPGLVPTHTQEMQ